MNFHILLLGCRHAWIQFGEASKLVAPEQGPTFLRDVLA